MPSIEHSACRAQALAWAIPVVTLASKEASIPEQSDPTLGEVLNLETYTLNRPLPAQQVRDDSDRDEALPYTCLVE